MPTEIVLQKRRFICSCDMEHAFDEQFDFLRKYQRQTIPFEKYVFKLSHKNTIKNASEIADISECKCQRKYNHHAGSLLEAREPEPLRLLGIDDIARRMKYSRSGGLFQNM